MLAEPVGQPASGEAEMRGNGESGAAVGGAVAGEGDGSVAGLEVADEAGFVDAEGRVEEWGVARGFHPEAAILRKAAGVGEDGETDAEGFEQGIDVPVAAVGDDDDVPASGLKAPNGLGESGGGGKLGDQGAEFGFGAAQVAEDAGEGIEMADAAGGVFGPIVRVAGRQVGGDGQVVEFAIGDGAVEVGDEDGGVLRGAGGEQSSVSRGQWLMRFNEESMETEQNPALSAEREAFRKKYNVRLVESAEEGTSILRLPEGVYGFATAPASDEMPVFAKPVFRCTELIRTKDEILMLGYLNAQEAKIVEEGAEPAAVTLYPEPYEQATQLVAIPLSRIDRRRPPTRDEGNSMKVEVGPAA